MFQLCFSCAVESGEGRSESARMAAQGETKEAILEREDKWRGQKLGMGEGDILKS